MSGHSLFLQIRKDVRSALLSFLSFAVILLVTIESISIFTRGEAVNRLVLEQSETIARSKLLASDYIGLQQELTHFVESVRTTLPYSIHVELLLNDSKLASEGTLGDSLLSPSRYQQISLLPSGDKLKVVADIGIKRTIIEILSILCAIIVGCFGLYRFLIYKLEKSFSQNGDPIQQKLNDAEVHEKQVALAEQVAHDIRSPLITLAMIVKDAPLSVEDESAATNALTLIRDVLNDIGRRPTDRAQRGKVSVELTEELLNPIVEELVNEKRRQWADRDLPATEISAEFHGSTHAVRINRKELVRALSNIIDNAYQALTESSRKIRLLVGSDVSSIYISVTDNGSGMCERDIARLGERGLSFGKRGGTGLGVFHAMETMKAIGGTLAYKSKIGEGTTAKMTFPLIETASPIIENVRLASGQLLVVADDDPLIHQLVNMIVRPLGVSVKSLFSPEQFDEEVESLVRLDAFFFVDYEFKGSERNGVQLISESRIQDRAVLISGQVDCPEVKLACEYFEIRRFPKLHLSHLDIRVTEIPKSPEIVHAINQ